MAIRYQRRIQRSKPNIEAAHSIDSKRNRLQKLMDAFEIQADQYLHQLRLDDSPISTMADYEEFNVRDGPDNSTHTYADPSDHHEVRPSDGSGIDIPNIEDQPVLLPSSLGVEWCIRHGFKHLALKEAQLRYAQANDSIHHIHLALGFKSTLFRTQVRPASTQKTKTHAWNAINSIDTTVQEHARKYCMTRDAYQNIRAVHKDGSDLPPLQPEDLYVTTLVLGAEQIG